VLAVGVNDVAGSPLDGERGKSEPECPSCALGSQNLGVLGELPHQHSVVNREPGGAGYRAGLAAGEHVGRAVGARAGLPGVRDAVGRGDLLGDRSEPPWRRASSRWRPATVAGLIASAANGVSAEDRAAYPPSARGSIFTEWAPGVYTTPPQSVGSSATATDGTANPNTTPPIAPTRPQRQTSTRTGANVNTVLPPSGA